MSVIKLPCPHCGKEVQINIKTIDTLREKLEAMTRDRDFYKSKLAALELKVKAKPNDPFGGLFDHLNF